MTNSSSIKELVTKFSDKTTDDERIEGYQVLLDKQKHEISPSDELVSGDIGRLLKVSYSDVLSKNLELASRALKCLGYFIHHPVYVQSISDEEAATILLTLVKAVSLANDKVHCNLSMWCISVQQFKATVVDLHIESLVGAIVHAIDNPMGSLAVTFEAMQALATIRKITPTKTREHSHVWAPPIYRRLISNVKRERDVADSALREMLPAIEPPTPTLSQVTAIDIKKSLLTKIKTMVATSGQAVVAINAWRWFIILLGDQLVGSASMVNEMLKIPEATFISNDAQARIASQVSWESLIDALVPVFTEWPPEMSQLRPKRLKLLLMPILNAIKFEQDAAVKNQYWQTWMHLLRRLDRRLHEPHVFENAVIPGLEAAFQSGPLKDPWIWKNCLELVESYVSSRSSVPPDFRKLAILGLDNHDQSLPSLQQVANVIKWEPWRFTGLESLLTIVRTLWDCGMKEFQENHHSTSGRLSMYAAVKIWYIIVKAVETDQRNIVTPSSEQVGAVHSLLRFVSKIPNPEKRCGMECLTWTWRFMNVLVDELGPIILASTFYKIASPWEDSDQFSAEDLPSQNTSLVSPVIYLIAVWLKLVSVEPLDQSEEVDILQRIGTLIRASKAGDNMGNLQGIMTSLDWLSKLTNKGNRDTLLEKKGVRVFLLKVWRVVTEQLKTHIEGVNDIPSGDTGYLAIFTVLLFPVKSYLQGEVQGNLTELKSVRICWIQLHDTLCRISSLKNSHSNSCSAGFFQRVLKVIDGQVSRDNGERLANLSEFVQLVGTGVISALNQVEVSSVAVLALNRKRKRFTILGGSGIDDANNVKDLLSVAARLLTLAATNIDTSSAEVTISIMQALWSYAKRIYSQHDTLLLLHALAKPLACWLKLGLHKDLSMALVEKLHKLWDGLLYCLKECQPALLFDSNLLAVQASSLAYALQHPYHPISNITLSFWEATFGSKASSLKFPSALVSVLKKLKRKVAITLPGFDAVKGEKRTKQIRSLEADNHMEEKQPTRLNASDQKKTTHAGTKSAMVLGVDNENTNEPFLDPASKDKSVEELRSTSEVMTAVGENADPRKKVGLSDQEQTNRQNINGYVVVDSSQLKKSRPLTDHQKEVRKLQRREGPGVKTYTCADFSQGDLPGDAEDPEADMEGFCLKKLDIIPAAVASTSAEAEKNSKIASASRQTTGIARAGDFVNEALAYAADFTAPDSMQLIIDDNALLPSDKENLEQRFTGSEQEAGTLNRDDVEAPRKLKRGRQTQRTYPMRNSSSTAEMNTSPFCEQKNVVEQGMSKLIGSKTTMGMLATLATWSRWDELDAEELLQAKMLLELIQEKVGCI